MRLSARIAFALLLVGSVCDRLIADTVLFDDRIDSQQKTEIRYDAPDGCVITGLGFRANYDNVTTMHLRHHRLTTDGRLTDGTGVRLGSEPNHACEARIDLPAGWVAVGYGAAGEPEWDVTLLRIWARQLQPDGTLGEIKTFSNGFKPDREPEREVVLGRADRVLTGAGLRFASNDIGGIYARSKRILNLTDEDRKKLGNITTRAWAADPSALDDIEGLVRDITKYNVNRIDVDFREQPEGLPNEDQLSLVSKLCAAAPKMQICLALRTASTKSVLLLLKDAPQAVGIVLDLPFSLKDSKAKRKIVNNIHEACTRAGKRLHLYYYSASGLGELPDDIGVVLHLIELTYVRKEPGEYQMYVPLRKREIVVQVGLFRYSAPNVLLPDIRTSELPGYLLEAALAGATGFIASVNPGGHYLPESVNAAALAALHRLADNPLQSTDVIWDEFCASRYGPAAEKAASALKRTAAINDLIFMILGRQLLWIAGNVPEFDIAQKVLERYETYDMSREGISANSWRAGDNKILELAMQEKETAFWLLAQSVPDANQAYQMNPTPYTRALRDAMLDLKSAAGFWTDATRAFMLARVYAIDGAPATRASAEAAINRLRDPQQSAVKFEGADTFAASVEKSLAKSAKEALFIRSLNGVRELAGQGQDEAAVAALLDILNSETLAPHLSKQNQAIGEIASSLKGFGEMTSNIAVMRHGDGSWGIEKVAHRWSWAIGPERPCLYLDFPGGPLKEPADYILSFEYFDKGDWTIHCHYDSAYPPDDKREYHPADPVQLTDTKTWKKGAFLLSNCRFASRQNDRADMRFVTGSGANIRNIQLAQKPTGAIDPKRGKRLFYRILGSQSNGPYVRKTRTVASPDYLPRTATTGMANAGYTEYPFCYGNWSLTYREREGLFPRFAMSLPMDPARVNTCDILADWVYEPDGCVWGPACCEFGQTFVAADTELVAITLLVASPKGVFDLSVHEGGPNGALIARRKSFTSGHSMEWATIHYAPGEAPLQPDKTYYIKIVRQDGKAWNPYFHAAGNAYDKGCAYFDGIQRPESDLALWITTEPPDVSRGVVLDTDEDGWTKPASGFEFVPRTDNTRMITVQLRPVKEFCVRPIAYVYELEPERKLICGPKYSHSCARVNTTYEASFLYAPGELPCTPGKKYYAEIFTVLFEEGKDPVIPDDHASLATYEILPSVYGEIPSEAAPIIYNLAADASKHSTVGLTWRLSKPARVEIEILAHEDIAKTVNVTPGTNEYRIFGLGPGDDCDFRLTASSLENSDTPVSSRPTPIYRVRVPGGEPASPLWPETPEFFVPLAPRPTAKGLLDERAAGWKEVRIPDGDFESGLGKWTEDKTGIAAVSRGDAQIKPASGRQMYGWTLKAGKDRKDVFLENSIHQTIPTKPGHKYVLTARAQTKVTNGTRGDTRVRLAVDPTGGDELKGKNSSQWFWTDGKWMTLWHEFTARSEKATIAVAFFRWRDLDRADAHIDNIRLYDLGPKP